VRLVEFGRVAILVEDEAVRPRIAKTYELLAYLLTRRQHRAERDELLDALFEGRADDSTRAYLRQAIRWLRSVLPRNGLMTERAVVALSDQLAIVSESAELERALAHAARQRGAERLAATVAALEIVDHGPYLPAVASPWAEERRQHLQELTIDGRYEAAELAFSAGELHDAERLTETILETEPFHEPAWRLAMRVASARGDDHGVLRSYQRCNQVLADVGAEPSHTTRQLVDQLRR
jgi:DNA-binding SARP family transcriptional activator